MKVIKRIYKIILVILILMLLIPPFKFFVLKDSVMEEIYRSVKRSYYNINDFEGIDKLDYENVERMLWVSNNTFLFTQFEEDYLNEGFEIELTFPVEDMINQWNINIQGLYYLSESVVVNMNMQYNHASETIIYNHIFIIEYEGDLFNSTAFYDEATIYQYLDKYNITKEDIKNYQHYILYDVVYQSWVSGTDNGRKLNKWDYYNIKEVDNTFNFEVTE